MKIAYCILVHKNPQQVSRLLERIYSPSDYFYIHKDIKSRSREWEEIFRKHRSENSLFASKYRSAWGTFGIVEALLDGMKSTIHIDYDYLVDLSGQCYPIKPLNYIKQELGKKSVAYMEYFKLPYEDWNGMERISHYYLRFGKTTIGVPRIHKALPYALEPYGGSTWWLLPKRFVEYILEYVSNHPRIVDFYRYANISDEMFFQTIIMNSSLRSEVVVDTKRIGTCGIDIIKAERLDDIMRSDKLFARKFDIHVDTQILDLIDKEIIDGHAQN
jgi:hypothetical protein